MDMTPEILWLITTTIGVVVLGFVIGWSVKRYRSWRERRSPGARPTD